MTMRACSQFPGARLFGAAARGKLYAIIDWTPSKPDPIGWARCVIEAGAPVVQLRAKFASTEEIIEIGRKIKKFCGSSGTIFIVNDDIDAAVACGADGVHLGQEDESVVVVRERLGYSYILGHSTHNPDQLSAAIELPVDYIAVGPVYATATKKNPAPVIGIDGVRRAREMIKRPMVAIGGITLENAQQVVDAGADFVAVISDLQSAADIRARAAAYRNLNWPGKQN